jgi:hypothetical protein
MFAEEQDDVNNEGDYEEDDFEEEDAVASDKPPSPAKRRISTPKVGTPGSSNMDRLDEKDNLFEGGAVDLDKYIRSLNSDEEEHGQQFDEELAKTLQPLDGIRPSVGDMAQEQLSFKLGYTRRSNELSSSSGKSVNHLQSSM